MDRRFRQMNFDKTFSRIDSVTITQLFYQCIQSGCSNLNWLYSWLHENQVLINPQKIFSKTSHETKLFIDISQTIACKNGSPSFHESSKVILPPRYFTRVNVERKSARYFSRNAQEVGNIFPELGSSLDVPGPPPTPPPLFSYPSHTLLCIPSHCLPRRGSCHPQPPHRPPYNPLSSIHFRTPRWEVCIGTPFPTHTLNHPPDETRSMEFSIKFIQPLG